MSSDRSAQRSTTPISDAGTARVNSYIVKPVDFEKFVEAARELGSFWLLFNQTPGN